MVAACTARTGKQEIPLIDGESNIARISEQGIPLIDSEFVHAEG